MSSQTIEKILELLKTKNLIMVCESAAEARNSFKSFIDQISFDGPVVCTGCNKSALFPNGKRIMFASVGGSADTIKGFRGIIVTDTYEVYHHPFSDQVKLIMV